MMLLSVVSETQAWGHIMAKKVSANFHMQNCIYSSSVFPTQLFHPPYGTFLQKLAIRFFLKKVIQVLNKEYKKPRNEAFYWF